MSVPPLSPKEEVLIWRHAHKEMGHAEDLIERGPETPDDFKDIANTLRQAASRFDSLAELEREEAVR